MGRNKFKNGCSKTNIKVKKLIMPSENLNLHDTVNSSLSGVSGPFILMFSGGQDSVVLGHILFTQKRIFHVIHVNYGLRGKESIEDEKFVIDWCEKHFTPHKIIRSPNDIKTSSNVQSYARSIRYKAAQDYSEELNVKNILTAHHLNDSAETFLFHAARGTGIDGLISLSSNQGSIYRPLWSITKNQIQLYAKQNKLAWREDSTNHSDKYTRNHIRHNSLSFLIEAIPQTLQGLRTTQKNLRELSTYVNENIEKDRKLYVNLSDSIDGGILLMPNLFSNSHGPLLLKYFLKGESNFDFHQVKSLLNSEVGSHFESKGWQIWKEREGLILLSPELAEKRTLKREFKIVNDTSGSLHGNFWDGKKWTSEKEWGIDDYQKTEFQELNYEMSPVIPIDVKGESWVWRTWSKGDYIFPFGMKGKKNVSDVLRDSGLPSCFKHLQLVLSNSKEPGEVFWIPGQIFSRSIKTNEKKKYIRIYEK